MFCEHLLKEEPQDHPKYKEQLSQTICQGTLGNALLGGIAFPPIPTDEQPSLTFPFHQRWGTSGSALKRHRAHDEQLEL